MFKWTTLPPHVAFTLTDPALRTVEIPVLPAVLGRRGADVVIEHPSVCKEHAVFDIAAGVLAVRDLGSRNGTFVNGRQAAARTAIKHGDELRVGAVAFRVGLTARPRKAGTQTVDPNGRTVPLPGSSGGAGEAVRCFMLVAHHQGHRRQYLLDKAVQTVGRLADIRVADPLLSRKHVQIEIEHGRARVKDLASANGTYVAGQAISVVEVDEEIEFRAGDTVFQLVAAQRR
jgi:pSer/pThr/pTyr-binding forkhead associated (FHA) protein